MRNKGRIANFQQFGGGKEGHIDGEMVDGVNQDAFFEDQVLKFCFFCFDGAVNTCWAATDDNEVVHRYNVEVTFLFFDPNVERKLDKQVIINKLV